MSTGNRAIVKAPGHRMRLPIREALETASRSMSGGLAAGYLEAADKAASASTIAIRSRVPTLARTVEDALVKSGFMQEVDRRAVSASRQAIVNSPALAELTQQFVARGLGANLRPEIAQLAEEHLRDKGLSASLGSQVTRLAEQRLGDAMSGVGADVQRLAETFPSSRSFNFIRNQRDLERIQRRFPTLARRLPVEVRRSLMLGDGASSAAMLTGNHSAIARMVAEYTRPTTSLGASALAEYLAASTDIRWSQPVAARLLEQRFAGAGLRETFDLNASRQRRGVVAEPTSPAPAPRSRAPHPTPRQKPSRRPNHQAAPVAASYLAERDRRMVVALLEAAELEREHEHLDALEERLRAGHAPARNHVAVSARQLLLGVANHCFPARSGLYICRFKCPHEVGAEEVVNRISAFVDQQLSSELDTREQKLFQAKLDWVNRWGGRGTHEHCTSEEVLLGFLRLLEVLAMVARAYGISPRLTS